MLTESQMCALMPESCKWSIRLPLCTSFNDNC